VDEPRLADDLAREFGRRVVLVSAATLHRRLKDTDTQIRIRAAQHYEGSWCSADYPHPSSDAHRSYAAPFRG